MYFSSKLIWWWPLQHWIKGLQFRNVLKNRTTNSTSNFQAYAADEDVIRRLLTLQSLACEQTKGNLQANQKRVFFRTYRRVEANVYRASAIEFVHFPKALAFFFQEQGHSDLPLFAEAFFIGSGSKILLLVSSAYNSTYALH